uniref:Spec3-like protein n=1 Tax=Oxytricha trifallax TaxID=94289 RepID=Q49I43_OXYTR|nr:spec3-like protein [Sterkiella histriomuscorum]
MLDDCQKKTIQKVAKPGHIILFILNIILPGWGTMVSSCISLSGFSTHTLIVGFLQFITCWFILGWIWSIWWGYLIYKKSL